MMFLTANSMDYLNDNQPIIHAGFSRCASTFLITHIFPKLKNYEFRDSLPYAEMGMKYLSDIDQSSPIFDLPETDKILISEKNFTGYDLPLSWRKYGHRLRADIFITNITKLFKYRGRLLFIIRRQDSLIESVMRKEHAFMDGDKYFIDYPVTGSILDKKSTEYIDESGCRYDYDLKIYKRAHLINRYGITYTHTYDYFDIFKKITSKIDKARIHILLYEDLEANPQKFYGQLSEIFGEDVTFFLKDNVRRERASTDDPDILNPLLRSMMFSGKFKIWKALIPNRTKKIMRRVFSRSPRLTQKFKDDILSLYAEGNVELAKEFNLDLKKYNYY